MEDILKKALQEQIDKNSTLQLVVSLLGVVIVVGIMSKHFKSIIDALPTIQKTIGSIQKWFFNGAIFRKDVLTKLDNNQLLMNEQNKINERVASAIEAIQKELTYNGGSSLKDNVREIKESIEYNKQNRDINDKCSDRMQFKVDSEGACTFINDAFLKYFGWRESDVLEFGFENLVHDDDRNQMQLKWTKAINTKTSFRDDQRIKDRVEDWHNCEVIAHPIIVRGKLIEFSGVINVKDKI